MATIRTEASIEAPAQHAWDAVRDVGAIHLRLAPGFVLDTRLDGDTRVVTFANGVVARERIVTIDDAARRLAYTIIEGSASFHSASIQILPEGADRCRLVWITDLLPDSLAPRFESMMQQGTALMKRTMESAAAGT
jgi:hypothetical protein